MISRNRILAALTAVFSLVWLIGFAEADAQQAPPNPQTKSATPTPTATPPPVDDPEVIKIDSDVVNILFTAQDKNRRLLTTLGQGDVKLLENGEPQEIVAFSRQVDLPLSLAILIDVSASQERTLPEEKLAAISFLETVIRPAKDEVCVVSFTGEATLEQGMTNNMQRLRRAVSAVRFNPPSGYIGGGVIAGTPPISGDNQAVQGSTAIWDAIWVTSDEILGPAPERTRRAIILLSDGVNTFGKKKLDDAVQAALRSEAVIYSIGIGDNFYSGVDKGSLNKISERTGGRAYYPRDEGELRDAFKQIQDEMRSQYLIAYEPTNQNRDGSYRKIEIQVTNPKLKDEKVKVTHRQGYFAKTQKK
ncbi:MAG TPA: VWA domain-containing protein [Pyrinomonadaceae bacterium]|nr:VWA domain-containing protein [Acidobacteriota bacterium]HQZ96705.1 VWA domain-containing protein [Pyrinomonadaceae bacterium]